MVNPEMLIGSLIRGAFASRKRGGRKAMRFLTGRRRSFLNASTLMTAAGVVWGLVESATARNEEAPSPGPARSPAGPSGRETPLPLLPRTPGSQIGADAAAVEEVPEAVLRLVRLTVSAARADGELSREETDLILEHAVKAGAGSWVETEIRNPKPLAEIVSGLNDPQSRADMYTLGYVIVRADTGVTGAERIYLAQLANHLGLDHEETSRLEREADAGIEQE